jgi:hypothetical protein
MQIQSLSHRQQKLLFIFGITVIYLAILAWLDFLQGPIWWDEGPFWESSLTFNDNLWPTLEELRNYHSLNTPLPFIIFGGLDYLFGGGMVTGRLFNLILSLVIVAIIGWPSKEKGGRALLCLIGLFLCPYFLWLSGRLYTEMVACTLVLMGFVAYFRNRILISAVAFTLGIAARQYMIAFPLAVATYEFIELIKAVRIHSPIDWTRHWRWIAPTFAVLSMGFWIFLFQGLAPDSAIAGKAPAVQKSTFAVTPGGIINFLAFVGVYIVIPEFLLFRPETPFKTLRENRRKYLLIAGGLLIFCLIFPPMNFGNGMVIKLGKLMPTPWLHFLLFYSLALLACLRFSKPDLYFWLVLFNALIMMKALPWDRYALPLVIIFWYLKSIHYPAITPTKSIEASNTEP